MEKIRKAIYAYARAGLPVFPLCPHDHYKMSEHHLQACNRPGKCPLIRNWQNAVVPTPTQIDEWLQTWPKFNIGLLLGSRSGIIGIDVDNIGGQAILQEWSKGELPETSMFTTPNQGIRYLYRISPYQKYQKVTRTDHTSDHSECALLGDGCQTVLPPSIHNKGGRYQWKI